MKSTQFQHSFQTIKSVGEEIRHMVESQMRGAALNLAYELMQQEVQRLCGAPFSRKVGEQYHRGGSDPGSIIFHGQRIGVKKPRVRRDGKSVELDTYTALDRKSVG